MHASGEASGNGAVVENVTFDEIRIGQSASLSRQLTLMDVELFATVSGNVNPAHLDPKFAADSRFQKVIGPGMWSGSLISGVLGSYLPGAGSLYAGQSLQFRRPVGLGDIVTATVTVTEKRPAKNVVVFDCVCTNQDGEVVVTGTAEVIAPTQKVVRPAHELPQIQMIRHDKHDALLAKCDELPPVVTAVAHPCDESSLRGAVEAAMAGLIDPILVGPEAKIRSVADACGLDVSRYRIVDAAHSHAAAQAAVALARTGACEAVMKGSLHTDELMSEVVKKETGLRTGRRLSHVFVMNVPTYPRALLITDAAINIYPTLEDKVHIVQNAIDLAKVLGVEVPRVAILSAVETLNPKIATTLEAAALCKMADRGQITGGILDGPLAFDNAISAEAARTKGITSEVAGQADILLVPDLEAGNMLAKQLSFLANADAAGIVLGARVPIILTSRADAVRTRLASCAVASLVAASQRRPTLSLAAE
ncbi:bifunctional enoyl-CoA hydratase/phosphate acetyltransferase [Azospirillum picis]|uniref:Phosphotransacetylase/acyl dehydratase n=1 Tax=Azospirillum picis TaxID=488438 RepID=A0ABU0MQF6_9PROT|nr:bifunctional enoyl-CoA hydratase/phosphate acetyltransferase [Azospirillum picis]MBP2302001.1 phosphotransacetylase/acyl dehydratase [Azospirillum picis]MDQ0535708.1 phosphotransacetylase/acyl dehydratase [Azospirillum picis]